MCTSRNDWDLPSGVFDIFYADPPWDYKGQKQHAGKGSKDTGSADSHYKTLSLGDLKSLPVPEMSAEDSILFMWSTSPHLNQAIELGNSWGFKWATIGFVWDKVRVNPGFYTMSQCELCLIFKHGKIPQPRGARNIRQFLSEKRGDHSSKPDEVRDRISLMFPHHRKIELFARSTHKDWVCWGEEVGIEG